VIQLDLDLVPAYGIITTQTCDLDEQVTDPKEWPEQPWFQVAPVLDRSQDLTLDQQRQVEHFWFGHLVKVTSVNLPPGFWAVDLRILLPLEKSCLVDRDPIPGFQSEEEYLRFADHLARRFDRPALANVVSNRIVRELRRALRGMSRSDKREVRDRTHELLLEIAPSRDQPRNVRLVVVTDADPPSDRIRNWFDRWNREAQGPAVESGLLLFGNRYATYDTLTAREYLHSIKLDFRYLSPDDDAPWETP